jgi:wobble nucleotide-excising tRNase
MFVVFLILSELYLSLTDNILYLAKNSNDNLSTEEKKESISDENILPSPRPSDSVSVQQERRFKEELHKEDETVGQGQSVSNSEIERR